MAEKTLGADLLRERLAWSKERWGLGQAWLAEQLGVTPGTVSAWVMGHSIPLYEHMVALEVLFGRDNTTGQPFLPPSAWITRIGLERVGRMRLATEELERRPPVPRKLRPHEVDPRQLRLFQDSAGGMESESESESPETASVA